MFDLNKKIPPCDMDAEMCANLTAALILNVLNAASILINILHLVVLSSLQSLRDKSYRTLLISLCTVDIWCSVSMLLATNCALRTFLSASAPLPTLWNLIICILLESGSCVRFLVHCLSSFERYLAVCKPFSHRLSMFVRHLKKAVAAVAILTTAIITCTKVMILSMGFEILCIHSVYGPTTNVQSLAIVVIGASLLISALPIVTFTLLALTWWEIVHLHRTAPQHSAATKFAVKYVTIINVMFLCLMVPLSAIYVVCSVFWSQDSQPPESIIWFSTFSKTLYSIFNCLIYAGMSATYRDTFVKVFIHRKTFCKKSTAVVPHNDRGPHNDRIQEQAGAGRSI